VQSPLGVPNIDQLIMPEISSAGRAISNLGNSPLNSGRYMRRSPTDQNRSVELRSNQSSMDRRIHQFITLASGMENHPMRYTIRHSSTRHISACKPQLKENKRSPRRRANKPFRVSVLDMNPKDQPAPHFKVSTKRQPLGY
jgi:hypothetical protein